MAEHHVKLTDLTVKNAKPGPVRREIPDATVRGFQLIVQTSGVKSFALRYRSGGRARKLTIGRYPAIDLANARKLAKQAIGEIAHGKDPGAEKIQARRTAAKTDELGPTTPFAQVVDEFVAKHINRKTRPATQRQATGILTREFGTWAKRPIGEIGRSDVHRVLDRIVDGGHIATANRAKSYLSMLFNWAIERGIVDNSPLIRMRQPGKEVPRDRVLSDEELVPVLKASAELPAPYPAIIRLLATTGARLREIAEMEWSELDLDTGTWTLPKERAKNKRKHALPLPRQALAILEGIPRLHGSRFVFTHAGHVPVGNFGVVKRALDKALPDLQPWVFHDLRRTCATGLAKLGVPVHVTEAALNHRSGTVSGIAAVYIRHDYAPEMKEALQRWADRIDALTGANVVSLRPEFVS